MEHVFRTLDEMGITPDADTPESDDSRGDAVIEWIKRRAAELRDLWAAAEKAQLAIESEVVQRTLLDAQAWR